MCDNQSGGCGSEVANQVFRRFKIRLEEKNYKINCKKCEKNPGFVLLQKKDVFCGPCLIEYCTHKFRSAIGKSHRVKPGDRILVGFSAGPSSLAMISMIRTGLDQPDEHRRLRFQPALLFIDQSILQPDMLMSREIFEFIRQSRIECFVTTLQSVLIGGETHVKIDENSSYEKIQSFLFESNQTPEAEEFRETFEKIQSSTSQYDFLVRLRNLILIKQAQILDYSKVFVATTTDELALGLINNICLGRGMSIQSEMDFCDDRYGSIQMLRPMRDLSRKEIAFYLRFQGISQDLIVPKSPSDPTSTGKPIKSSIHRINEHFLLGLAEEFPATLYTVFKTGNKIKPDDKRTERCRFCRIQLDLPERDICSAFDALRLTSLLSTGNDNGDDNEESSQHHYCYSCLRIQNDIRSNFEKFCILHHTI